MRKLYTQSKSSSAKDSSSQEIVQRNNLSNKKRRPPMNLLRLTLLALVILATLTLSVLQTTRAKTTALLQQAGKTYTPSKQPVTIFSPVNVAEAARREALAPTGPPPAEIKAIDPPKGEPPTHEAAPINKQALAAGVQAPLPSATGSSPGPSKSFKGEFLSATSIPPDTMGVVGTTHVVNVTNDRMRIQTRDGVEISRVTLTSFWAGVTIKGVAISAFDPKIYYDRFNNRYILISSGNGQGVNSGAMFAVSQTNDPTGLWNRYSVAADNASTATGGHWIDYPTVGFNKNWIVVDENVFNFGTAGNNTYWGQQVYVLDKQAAYNNTLSSISLFEDPTTNCTSPFESKLGCGFTMAPAITEDNTTDTEYLVEDWDATAGQLRLSKITGTPSAPVLTVGTQFPQSSNSWRFNAARITTNSTQTGGYVPQRQQSANLVSGTRIMANDSRMQNSVLRNGTLWCTHTVMLASTPTAAGTGFGTTNPDNHSAIQWWQIDPTIETGLSTSPLQRARIEDPSADNCHNGASVTVTTAPCSNSTANQHGTFFAFPNISVNQNNDVLIGFTQFSALTYPNAAYAIRLSADPVNTTRDPVVFRPGQSNYNIGAGSGSTRQNRWGDYSAAQTDPINDTDFWTVQEYAGTNRNDFLAPSYAGPWETWWALIKLSATAPSTSGSLIISEFRLRGPQGVRDEFVEVYNPGNTPVIVNTTDNSDGWALAFSTNGTAVTGVAVIPNGTVIPPGGHFLIADNPDNTAGGTSALTYSLNGYPSAQPRNADSDTGWSLDLADNGGVAIFKTANTANFNATTRMDSVGFSSIAAGLFKEGNGIPAISATTPTGQMTFFRNLSSGTPQDTGTNENDFIFADPVIETLTVTPRLGAAGPENLNSPIHLTSGGAIDASLLDAGAGQGSPANLFRDPTVVTNGVFGTITFRRTFTNNTGLSLPRLRFRIVNITTNPAAGAAADLRALTSGSAVVTLSGGGTVNVDGTTLETPPAQTAGAGFNSSYSIPSVNFTTPLLAGQTRNLQFTLGVQVVGQYNFCIIVEGDPPAASSVLCFTGTTENTAPTIAGATINRTAGDPASSATIANVNDGQDVPGSLMVTAINVPAGISVTGITNGGGTVTASVAASCSATPGANNVILQVKDSEGATANATLVVNVTATPVPTITPGGPTTFCAGGSVTLTSSSATGNQWFLNGNPIGGAANQTYIATASGDYTVQVNGCASATSAITTVTVNPTPPTPTITPGGPTSFCPGGSVTLTSSSATGNQWSLNGNPIGGATNQTYVATASGSYTVVVTQSGCSSPPSSAVTVTASDTTPPTVSCPANITKSTDPNQCTAVVTYTTPAGSDNCTLPANPVVCSPPSNSTFPKGTTSVTCTVTDAANLTGTCSFSVIVNDTQLPTITCPSDILFTTPGANDPCGTVNYPAPTTTDNCTPTPTIVCNPPSGSCFAVGMTTVNCTATDGSGNQKMCSFKITVQNPCAAILCPANIIKATDPNQCGAVVSYAAPTPVGTGCGVISCSPASGGFFPKGTTTVSCTSTAGPGCAFTVTVNDTQPPVITCPGNQTRVTAQPGNLTVVVSYPAPTISDNCPMVSGVCVPPSGATFNVGVTTVTCTATDMSGNTASCSFTVSVFNGCLQDDSNAAIVLLFNTVTGDYRFCCNGTVFTGKGVVVKQGSTWTLTHNAMDRRVSASLDASQNRGSASLQSPPGTTKCAITDRNLTNNSCSCQ
jgi:hypothetical protein